MSRAAALMLVLILALTACADAQGDADSEEAGDSAGLDIVATTSILGDVVDQLVGDAGQVDVLMPLGSDPHSFSLSAAQAERLREADLVVANGLGLEEAMLDALEGAEEDGVTVFYATDEISAIEFSGDHGHDDDHGEEEHSDEDEHDEHGHEEGGDDPHFWMDPMRVATSMTALAEVLGEVDETVEAAEWVTRGEEFTATMTELDGEVTAILETVPEESRVLVTSHEAFGYFADAYDFEIVGTIIPGGSTLAEPSAADIEELVEAVVDEGVGAVFAETTAATSLADVIAEEAGRDVEVALLYSGSLSEQDGPAATYTDFMRYNASTIADALG